MVRSLLSNIGSLARWVDRRGAVRAIENARRCARDSATHRQIWQISNAEVVETVSEPVTVA